MRLRDAPEHDCPDCEEHPTLVYEDSVGPIRFVGTSGTVEGGTTTHYFRCAMCGGRFRATGDNRLVPSERNRDRKAPEKPCFRCEGPMRVGLAVQSDAPPPSSGPRRFGGNYNRVESTLVWRCTKCGMTDTFKHADVLGFNRDDLLQARYTVPDRPVFCYWRWRFGHKRQRVSMRLS